MQMRNFYFGDRERGSSTTAFIEAVGKLIDDRAVQLRYYEFHGQGVDSGEAD